MYDCSNMTIQELVSRERGAKCLDKNQSSRKEREEVDCTDCCMKCRRNFAACIAVCPRTHPKIKSVNMAPHLRKQAE
jgi:hypothetical protein